jgi:hypothetical protein
MPHPHRDSKGRFNAPILGIDIGNAGVTVGNATVAFGKKTYDSFRSISFWTRTPIYGCVGLGWLIALFIMSGQFMASANGNWTFLHSNQNFCNFTSNFTTVAMTAPIVITNVQWALTGVLIAIPVIYALAAFGYWYWPDRRGVGEGRLWVGFSFADPIGFIVQAVVWGTIAFILLNMLGEKSWDANGSEAVATINYYGWMLIIDHVLNAQYKGGMFLENVGQPLKLFGIVPMDYMVGYLLTISLGVLNFAWIISTLVVPLISMYGQNISLPQGTLYAYSAFIAFMCIRLFVTMVTAGLTHFNCYTKDSNGSYKKVAPENFTDAVAVTKAKTEDGVVHTWTDVFIVGWGFSLHIWNFICGMIAIYGIADQYPTNYVRVV